MDGVYVEAAPSRLIAFPPAPLPPALPPPHRDFSFQYPFNISPDIYQRLLHINWPVTIATVYATTVWWLNRVNKRRKYKPWAVSKTTAFLCFVVAHNLALAVFSGWVNVGMFRAVSETLPSRGTPAGAPAVADALCKMHGPRGYGSAVLFDPIETRWTTLSRSVQLLSDAPDAADRGRLWNEGLGYYGWIFYLSKFYEVVDTMIILAKGKKSSLLQTYHHTGAMIGMWAGIRYMSPPIWCFVYVNSFIHTIMYTYYAASALGVRVPVLFKRTLTSMQIAQLVFGASYALLHLIVSYDIPVEVPHLVRREVPAAIPRVTSSVIAAAKSPNLSMFFKKLALRAAGGEGLAQNIGKPPPLLSQSPPAVHAPPQIKEEVKYSWTTARVSCIDTSGEVFAILINVLYLLPLIYLFVRFFVRSYLRRTERPLADRVESAASRLKASSTDAVKGIRREIREVMMASQGTYSDLDLSKTPTPSALSAITTPSTTSAPHSGAGTPPTVKPFTAAPILNESTWLGAGKGNSKRGEQNRSPASPPASPNPRTNGSIVEQTTRSPKDPVQLQQPNPPASPLPNVDSSETTLSLAANGTTKDPEVDEAAENVQLEDASNEIEPDQESDASNPEESLSEIALDEHFVKDEQSLVEEPQLVEEVFNIDKNENASETAVAGETGKTVDDDVIGEQEGSSENAEIGRIDENIDDNAERGQDGLNENAEVGQIDEEVDDGDANEDMDADDVEQAGDDVTTRLPTVERATPSPSPSEAQRNAEEAVRRAYEAADMATRKASTDDADSIISVETTFTIESIADESQIEARRYEIPGVDEALDTSEKEAERELQPETNN